MAELAFDDPGLGPPVVGYPLGLGRGRRRCCRGGRDRDGCEVNLVAASRAEEADGVVGGPAPWLDTVDGLGQRLPEPGGL